MGLQLLLLLVTVVGGEQLAFTRSLYKASIPENSAHKRYVQPSEKMGVHVASSHVQVRYKIVAGDKERQFKAESRLVGDFWLLLIRTRTESTVGLNREYEDTYRLQVKGLVQDTRHLRRLPDVHCEVLIRVTDTNDLSPFFFPTWYNVTVPEDTPLHSVLVKLNAYDPDTGINGEIYYRLLKPLRQFAVHPTMGTVLLTRPLDFQKRAIHQLTVVAEDRGPKLQTGSILKSGTAQVVVHVEAVNRHKPAIFVRHVHALVDVPEVWAVVVVTDDDPGIHGTIGGLAIVDGDADDHFTVVAGSQPGEFHLCVDPQRPLSPRSYTLTLRAWDQGVPSQFTDETVSISPSELSSVAPHLEYSHYEADVPEEAPPGTPLVQIKASGRSIVFHIESGNEDGHFALNAATGRVSTADWLDHEVKANYSLHISVTSGASKSQATVNVRVLDCNDHAPVFDPILREILLEENRPVGTKIVTVHARDEDEAENGYVSYSLVNLNAVPFSIDPFSGEISTTEVLDYETMRHSYVLRIRATDWGAPYQRQAEMALHVTLRDVNDHRPQFEKIDCVVRVVQGTADGTPVLTLSAVDFDDGGKGRVHYKMDSSTDSACFRLNASTGVLTLVCQLELPARVNVTATDGYHFADVMTVLVHPVEREASVQCKDAGVIDRLRHQLQISEQNQGSDHGEPTAASFLENRHSPELIWPEELAVNESTPVGSVLGYVQAKDPDHGYNGRLVYVISSGDERSCFRVDMHTGALVLVAALDYELAPSHLLNVTAYDQGQPLRSASQTIFVRVLDVNDNAPLFEKPAYSFVISEDAPNGTSVARLRASDSDQGHNAELHFFLSSERFHIDGETGLLTVRGPLDRERHDRHLLTVVVVDGALEDPLSSTATVSVVVRDVNDNAPRFARVPYIVRIREDLPVGALVTSVHAEDADFGENGRVQYSLDAGTFSIDADTGLVRLAATLDFEAWRLYNVTVQARDCGDPPFVSITSLIVEVEDVNENLHAPYFAEQVTSAAVDENQPPGTVVTSLSATDDEGVTYTIASGNGLGMFSIDNNGVVRTRVSLDHEACAHYWITVVARDLSPVPLEAFVDLHVAVRDLNDQVPLTEQPAYAVTVAEHAETGALVLTLATRHSPAVGWRLVDDTPGCFAIDPHSGSITTVCSLDREAHDRHVLEVVLSDEREPPLSSTTQVLVTLADVNDHRPAFTQPLYRFRVLQGSGQAVPLCQVLAVDPDDDDVNLTYSVLEVAQFSIDPVTGLLHAHGHLLDGDTHELTVQASDSGSWPATARVQIHVVSRPLTVGSAPVVHDVEVSPTLETDPVNQLVAIVHASDPDGDALWYSLAGGNEEGKFMIDCERGFIKLARPLDRETCASYNLTIQVTDGSAVATAMVHVEVLDANDNWPAFSESLYQVEVSESTSPGTEVLQLTATDADDNQRLFYSIQNSEQVKSASHFVLDSDTGLLSLASPLDHEASRQHLLTVAVRDSGGPVTRRGFARVLVLVTDHNDHAPEFLQTRYEVRVPETAAPGTALVQLRALDHDRGPNGLLTFSIASGNVGLFFSLDSMLGLLTLARELSRQTQPEFFLTVRAADHGEPPLNATATVHIVVSLADNAPPRFVPAEQAVEVAENQPAGTFLLALTVHSVSSSVFFQLESGASNHFHLDPVTGVLTTGEEPLDYEQTAVHRLVVRATNLAGATALAQVVVQVLDSNDHAPCFRQLLYRGTVSEAAAAGSAVLRGGQPLVVGAYDEDTGINAQLTFSVVETWARKLFRIDANTGAVSLVQPLDREQRSEHNFTVEVWDQGQPRLATQQPATVSVHVSDVNDSPPRFEHELYNTTLLLPTYAGVRVAKVAAHDTDLEGPRLRYALVAGDHEGHFEVRADTGEVMVREPSGLQGLYRLLVSVTDGRFETATLVMVSIGKANVGRLRFVRPLWEAAVRENEPAAQRVLLLSLLGTAVGEPVHFSLLAPSERFAVGPHSGLVTCLAPLDREERALHELPLEARSPLSVAHALLRVHVMDANDNAPIFVNRPYYSVITVTALPGDIVLKVEAIDLDEGPNGQVLYSLDEGDGHLFGVDESSGEIRLLRTPNRPDEHTLVLVARDQGSPSLESHAVVAVKVTDGAMPSFGKHFYSTSVAENVAPGTALLTVRAEGAHPLVFSVASDYFAIDRATGVLSLVEPLDYESEPRHELKVWATDSVSGARAAVPVTIHVEDINDCAPLFEQSWYNVSVSEATPVASPLLEVRASDRDGPKLELRLAADDTFHLEATGVLRLRAPLDREAQAVHRLQVVASDAGHPAPLSSTARIWVTVIDMNDNPPAFAQPAYTAAVDQRSRKGQFIARLVATDPDTSDQLSYAIVAGNDAQLFAIHQSTGVVTVSSMPPVWPPSGFELNVSVTDGVYQSYTQLRLVVVASNEHSPQFSQAVYEAVVAENLASGTQVARVSAADPDQGLLGKLTYAIRSDDCELHFRINDTTGELVTQGPLDHERRHLYEVPVSATDGGGRIAFAVVRVAVTDVNDNVPTFGAAEYEASIWTNTSVGTTLLKVRAFDQDEGSWLRYSLHEAPSNVSAILNITHDSGELYLKAPPKGGGVFQFFVRVSDQGEPRPHWAVVPVTVAVVPPPEELPLLEVPVRDLFVRESVPLGSPVLLALPPGTTLVGPASEFSIDSQGNLLVSAPLDRERQTMHHLMLRKETPRGLATAFDVTVHVLDDNDCEPVFDVLAYKTAVAENTEQGCVVARLVAHDPDAALRKLTFEFYEDTDPAADIFKVDPSSGVVTTLVALDREAVPFYNFTVRVRDDGLLSSSAWVYVEVLDINDNPPVFEHARYQVQVSEDAVAGTVVASLHIEDADQEPAPVAFYVLSGDLGQQFAVRSSGDVFVQRPLDRELLQNYTLSMVATDGLHVASTQLEITVLDSNDNPPICLKSKYTELVSENIGVGTAILTVEATDADESSQLHFYLSGQGSEDFVLDASSGVLHTSRPLDREQRPRYSLVAHVRDVSRWEWQCNSTVELLLSDVNDNAPVFGQSGYEVALPEDTSTGRLVAQLHASDSDLGPNRRVSYSLVEASSQFSVDAHSGLVRLEQPLDREQCARFNLTVQAQDHGQPPLASRTHLAVTVQDINDSPPEFTQQMYAAGVSEAAPVGSPISVGLKATSRDVGVNAQITYTLVAGNDMGHFSIEPKTGVLRVARPLDYEDTQSYQLAVEARDGGEPPLSARAWLNVSVLDANDNAPVFGGPYSATVSEDASPGQNVIQIQASDADSGGELRYTLLQPGPFSLDPGTGQLSVAGPLDRETVSRYVLQVECWDGGTPPLSAQALVHVEVLDVNDHAPRFDQSNYTAVVHEGRQAGWTVLRFSLSDADSSLHGPPFQLELEGPSFFRIEGHELQLAQPLPPRSRHELRVRASDSGSPPLAAEAHVTVLAVEKSHFRPQVRPLSVLVLSYLDDFPGGLLGTVHATDEDPYDQVSLSLSGPHASLFVLDRHDGTLRALPGLDAGSYIVNVSASDGSTPPTHAPVTVHVMAVSEEVLKATVALRLTGTTTARFLAVHRRLLLRAVRTALGVRLKDVVLVSVQPGGDQLDVLLAVQLEGGPMPASTVAARLHERHVALEAAVGLRIHILPQGDRCPTLHCVHGECQDRLVLDSDDIVLLAADGHSLVSARHGRQTACVCNPGFGGDACEAAVDECAQQPCTAGRHCVPDASPLGHSCQCPPGRTGPQCDVRCQEPACYEEKRPISFGGQSYAHYVLSQSLDRRLSFSVMLRTLHPSGTLLHTSGPRDYAILEVSGGHVQYRFDCGSGEGLVRVNGRRVDDGAWHALHLERRGGSAQLTVDVHYEASGSAPGPHDVLNLEGRELHLGGAPAVAGLVGCLDNAQVGGQPLPLHLRPAGHAQLRRLANVHFSCHLVDDVCASQPCLNGATCRLTTAADYTCICSRHFQGPRCKEPVAEGQCTDVACAPANCQAKQCLHGGLCRPDGQCHCLAPYKGNRCELVEACAACESGETCVQLADGAFQCGCLDECHGGTLPLALPLGGAAAAVLLLLLLLALVCCCCSRHHRAAHNQRCCSNTLSAKNRVLATTNIRPKMSNLAQRPASYTTTREATLNNFDTVRSYGSAADDLESRYQPNDLRCHTPSGSAPPKSLYLDKIPNDLKAALSPPLAAQSSATSIASDLPGYCWDYSDLAAHAEEDVSSGDEAPGSHGGSDCSENTALQDERYVCHPDQYLPRHSEEPAVCAIEDSEEEA